MSTPRTLRRRLEDGLIHPAVSVLLAMLGLLFLGLGEAFVQPVRTRVDQEKKKLQDRTAELVAMQGRFTQAEKMDLETQLAGVRKSMLGGLGALRGEVMVELSDYFKKNGWGGRLIPCAMETPNPTWPELRALRLKIEGQTPRSYSETVMGGPEGRVARLLRKINSWSYPHLVTRMEMGMGGKDQEQLLFLEILFFQLP